MTRAYATLFDHRYLPQGLALYESLVKHSSEPFTFYILGLDDQTIETIERLFPWELTDGKTIQLFHYRYVEDTMELSAIRASRTWQEWCWTLASQLTELVMIREDQPNELTYLDADTFFFADPKVVFGEIGYSSIAITPHRLIPSKKHLERNGLYNVGFVSFRNTRTGRECLSRWAAQTRERCSADYGCGDQFYLNEWPYLYGDECHIIENIGVNAGPWSIGNWKVTEGPCLDGVPLVLYHAHEYLHDQRLTNYQLRPEDIEFIYKPYISAVEAAKQRVAACTQRPTLATTQER